VADEGSSSLGVGAGGRRSRRNSRSSPSTLVDEEEEIRRAIERSLVQR